MQHDHPVGQGVYDRGQDVIEAGEFVEPKRSSDVRLSMIETPSAPALGTATFLQSMQSR